MANLTDIMLELGGSPGEGPTALPTPEPRAAAASQIDVTLPVYGNPTTASVRQNFATAQVEITGLMQATAGYPFMPLAGGRMGGPMYLYNDPTDVMMPATKGYVDARGGGGPGGGGIPEAPSDGMFYSRSQGAWVPCVALSGGTLSQMTGELLLAGDPADPLGAVTKQYADVIGAVAHGAVPLAGNVSNPMTGLLILSGDPTAPLGAVTKQYADAGLALKANAANPSFTGVVTVGTAGRVIITGPTNPSLTLYNTTAGQPTFGVYNSGGYLNIGLTSPATGNPNGNPFMTFDQSGNANFGARVNVTGGRLISSMAGTASLTLNNTTFPSIFGLWSGSATNVLQFGLMDASGSPQTVLTTMDSSGSWITWGNLNVGNGASGGNLNIQNGTFFMNNSVTFSAGGGPANGNFNIGAITGGAYLASLGLFASTVSIPNGNLNASGSIQCNNFTTTGNVNGHDFVVNGTGIYYVGQGAGNYYQARWDGSGFYYWANTYGFLGPIWGPSGRGIKRNVAEVADYDALTPINAIPFYTYDAPEPGKPLDDDGNWTGTAHHECGFIAEDIEELIPYSVVRLKHLEDASQPDVLGPQWQPLVTYAIRAIQQLSERIAALEGVRQ